MSNLPESSPRLRRSPWALAMGVGLLAFLASLGAGLWVFHRIEQAPGRIWHETSAGLQKRAALVIAAMREVVNVHPRVQIRDSVFCEQTTEALELAVAKNKVNTEREMEHSWAGSTKRIRLRGKFEGRAGFDLTQPVTAAVTEKQVKIVLPAAKLLGVETETIEVEELSNGIWNRITPDDLEREIAHLKEMAWRELEQGSLVLEAQKSIEKRLIDKLGTGTTVTFSAPLPPKS